MFLRVCNTTLRRIQETRTSSGPSTVSPANTYQAPGKKTLLFPDMNLSITRALTSERSIDKFKAAFSQPEPNSGGNNCKISGLGKVCTRVSKPEGISGGFRFRKNNNRLSEIVEAIRPTIFRRPGGGQFFVHQAPFFIGNYRSTSCAFATPIS